MGSPLSPPAEARLGPAESGGRHSRRSRLWKVALPGVAPERGRPLAGWHGPPDTRQGKKRAPRMCCHLPDPGRGRPLRSLEVDVHPAVDDGAARRFLVRGLGRDRTFRHLYTGLPCRCACKLPSNCTGTSLSARPRSGLPCLVASCTSAPPGQSHCGGYILCLWHSRPMGSHGTLCRIPLCSSGGPAQRGSPCTPRSYSRGPIGGIDRDWESSCHDEEQTVAQLRPPAALRTPQGLRAHQRCARRPSPTSLIS